MFLSTYKVERLLKEINTSSPVLLYEVVDNLSNALEAYSPNWGDDVSSNEYKFASMIQNLESTSANLLDLYVGLYILNEELKMFLNSLTYTDTTEDKNIKFSFFDEFFSFIASESLELSPKALKLFFENYVKDNGAYKKKKIIELLKDIFSNFSLIISPEEKVSDSDINEKDKKFPFKIYNKYINNLYSQEYFLLKPHITYLNDDSAFYSLKSAEDSYFETISEITFDEDIKEDIKYNNLLVMQNVIDDFINDSKTKTYSNNRRNAHPLFLNKPSIKSKFSPNAETDQLVYDICNKSYETITLDEIECEYETFIDNIIEYIEDEKNIDIHLLYKNIISDPNNKSEYNKSNFVDILCEFCSHEYYDDINDKYMDVSKNYRYSYILLIFMLELKLHILETNTELEIYIENLKKSVSTLEEYITKLKEGISKLEEYAKFLTLEMYIEKLKENISNFIYISTELNGIFNLFITGLLDTKRFERVMDSR